MKFLFASLMVFSQISAQNTATQYWIEQACACFSASTQIMAGGSTALEATADSCAHQSLLTHYSALLKEYQTDIDNDSLVAEMGQRLGQKLYEDCAAYRNYFARLGKTQLYEKIAPLPTSTGFLVALHQHSDSHTYFWLWHNADSISTFLWLQPFEGAERFVAQGLGDERLRKATISWDLVQLFDYQTYQYITLPVVRQLIIWESELSVYLSPRQERQLRKQLKDAEK